MTVIVGAGLAGLTCAKVLAEAGRPFLLCEAAQRPGGRVVSDRHPEGFILDRGFQVLLDSYPSARRHLDYAALGGGRFRAGAMFVGDGRPRVLENPLRHPRAFFRAGGLGVLDWADRVRMLGLVGRAWLPRGSGRGADRSAGDLLRALGFSAQFFRRVARPFFGGVLLDPDLQTSGHLLLAYLRRFSTGRAVLPGTGMGGLAAQLASKLPAGSLRYDACVAGLVVEGGRVRGIRMGGGAVLDAEHVVLAVDEPAVCRLLGSGVPRPARSTAVHYFAASVPFYRGGWLCLPPRRKDSPVLHAALVSNVARSLAPEGAHLWSVTVFPGHARAPDAEGVAREVAGWFGAAGSRLRPLAYIEVPYAVPEQGPGFARRAAPWGELPSGLTVAGDARCEASIDAVVASGEAAAKKVISSACSN